MRLRRSRVSRYRIVGTVFQLVVPMQVSGIGCGPCTIHKHSCEWFFVKEWRRRPCFHTIVQCFICLDGPQPKCFVLEKSDATVESAFDTGKFNGWIECLINDWVVNLTTIERQNNIPQMRICCYPNHLRWSAHLYESKHGSLLMTMRTRYVHRRPLTQSLRLQDHPAIPSTSSTLMTEDAVQESRSCQGYGTVFLAWKGLCQRPIHQDDR